MNEDVSSANFDELDLESSASEQDHLRTEQLKVEEYNKNIMDIHPNFEKRKVVEKNVIVRLFKRTYAHEIDVMGEKSYIRAYRKVRVPDGLNPNNKQQFKDVDDPMPYLFEGVIIDFDERLSTDRPYLKKGLKIQLAPFNMMEYLYYPDRTKEDEAWDVEDLKKGRNVMANFEGYVKIAPSMIESYEE